MTEPIYDPTNVPIEDFVVPDLTEAVEGWRAWGTPADPPKFGVAPKLYSVTHRSDTFWVPRQINEAKCSRCTKPDKSGQVIGVPGEFCGCGYYSAKTLEHLMSMPYHQYDAEANGMFHIVGQVANWGKVIEGSQGWRSQFSYPVALYVPYEAFRLAKPLSEAYGVPCYLKNTLKPVKREL